MSSYPYPGLRPFAREETDIFFGREEHTITLLERLKENRFLAILGPSGYGKSSLVRTGLLAALEGGMLAEAGSHWRIADIRPGDAPFARLAEALTTNFQAPDREKRMLKKSLEKHLRRADFSLHEIYQDLAEKTEEDGGPAINLLILADQFEELFRLCLPHKRAEASAFVALLLAACRHPRIYVVITMRSEFLGECAQFYDLPEAINTGLFLTPRLTREQLREAIELPARVFGGNIEPRLTGRLLNDLGNRPDQLPVLAHALRYLWGVQKTPVLSLDNYLQTGSLDQVLSQRLDRIYEDLTPTQQKIAETMFRCLTERGDGKTDTRRPAPLEEIARVAACDWRDVAAAAQKFRAEGRNFLMPPPATALDDPAQILDISHESLIRQWHKLRGWIKAEAEKAEMYKRLLEAAQRRQQGEGGLWDGPDLAAALAWREKHQPAPEWAERYKSIISASKSVIPANKSAIPANKSAIPANKSVIPANKSVIPANKAVIPANAGIQKIGMSSRVPGNDGQGSRSTVQTGQFDLAMEFLAAGETAQRRARQRKIGFIAGFMLFLALTAAVMSVQWRQAVDAEQQAKQAAVRAEQAAVRAEQAEQRAEEEKQQRTAMLFDATLTHASLLARGEDYAEAKESLAKTYLLDAEILPQRRHARNLLAGYAEILGGAAEFVYEGAGAALSGVAISPDGRLLAVSGERATLAVFDVESGELLQRLEGHDPEAGEQGGVMDVVFHPLGAWLASAGDDGRIILWHKDEDGQLRELRRWAAPDEVKALAVSADGRILASSGTDKAVSLWDMAEAGGEPNDRSASPVSPVSQTEELSPGSETSPPAPDPRVGEGELSKGETERLPSEDKTAAPDRAQSAADNGASAPPLLRTLEGHGKRISSRGLAFSPDGRLLASGSYDDTARIWDVESGKELRMLRGHNGDVNSVAFSPDGQTIATSSEDTRLVLWRVNDGRPLRVFSGHANIVFGLAFTPDGRRLLSAGFDRTLRVWDVDSGAALRLFQGHDAGVGGLALHGGRAFSASNDGTVRRWGLDLPGQWLVDLPSEPISAAIALDGRWAAVGFRDGALRLYRVPDGELLWEDTKAHGDPLKCLAFSPTLLASAGFDDKAKLWRIVPDPAVSAALPEDRCRAASRGPEDACGSGTAADQGRAEGSPPLSQNGNQKDSAPLSQERKFFSSEGSEENHPPLATVPLGERGHPARNAARMAALPAKQAGGNEQFLLFSKERTLETDGTTRNLTGISLTLLRTLSGHDSAVHAVAFSPDGRTLATASFDGKIGLFPLVSPHPHGNPKHDAPASQNTETPSGASAGMDLPSGPEGLPDGGKAGVADENSVGQDGMPAPRDAEAPPGTSADAALQPAPEHLADAAETNIAGEASVSWGEARFILDAHNGNKVKSVSFYPDGDELLSSGNDNTPRLWDITPAQPRLLHEYPPAQDVLMWAALSPDGQRAAAVGRDQIVTVHAADPARPPQRLAGHEQTVFKAIFSPDGTQLATVSADATVRLWDLHTEKELFSLRLPTNSGYPVPLWDFDFRCPVTGECWLTIPLTRGKLALYRLAYADPPRADANMRRAAWREVLSSYLRGAALHSGAGHTQAALQTAREGLALAGRLQRELAGFHAPPEQLAGFYQVAASALWRQNKPDEAAERHARGLEQAPDHISLLSNDMELAFVQNDIIRAKARIAALRPLLKPDNELYAIVPFYAWLLEPEQGRDRVIKSIDELAEGVRFGWDFWATEAALQRLPESIQKQAEHFIAFFSGKIDKEQL